MSRVDDRLRVVWEVVAWSSDGNDPKTDSLWTTENAAEARAWAIGVTPTSGAYVVRRQIIDPEPAP